MHRIWKDDDVIPPQRRKYDISADFVAVNYLAGGDIMRFKGDFSPPKNEIAGGGYDMNDKRVFRVFEHLLISFR